MRTTEAAAERERDHGAFTHLRLGEVGNAELDVCLDEVVDGRALGKRVTELDERVEESGQGVVRGFSRGRGRSMVSGDASSTSRVTDNHDCHEH